MYNIFFGDKNIIFNMSVKVGVRVRPFNKRQQQLGARLCIQMDGPTTHLIDSQGGKKSFNYDYSFWSHDCFQPDQEGYSRPTSEKYADQRKVYDQIGSNILVNAWQGYNCCLFAYGQTGSGKSYSMIGYGANKGLIPIICNSIFQKIKANQDGNRSFEVKVSMMEIYNEAVRDLLTKNKKSQLKICEHKTLGVYVQGLEKHSVDSYQKIQRWIDQGSNNRSIAATLMNQSSSRSHTIVSINFVQKIQVSVEQTSVKYSTIHLVDLAGSECVAKTGVDSKDRLRQTAKINQSLTTLGRVIEILAQNCNKKQKDKQFVPYRDSKLTFILRNALGGNSQTAMICAVSPADDNYEQTLSTLRYASRAKKIENRAIVNESDVDKLIRLLREQNEMLKKMLQEAKSAKQGINYDMISGFNEMNKNMADMGILDNKEQENILSGLEEDSNYSTDNNSVSVNESIVAGGINGVNQNLPYLTNISEDQLLSFRIKYSCERLLIGNKQGNPKPDVVLVSLGVQPNHAFISYDSETKKCYLQATDQSSASYTYLNGMQVQPKIKEELMHLDRIIFGTGCVFMVVFKGCAPRSDKPVQDDIDYQFAISEKENANQQKFQAQFQKKLMFQEEQLRKKLVTQIEQDFENTLKENEELMKKQIEQKEKEYRDRIREMEQVKAQETERLLKQLQQRQQQSRKLQQEKLRIKQEVQRYYAQTRVHKERQAKEKEELQNTKQSLEHKMRQINQLQHKIIEMQAKTEQKKQELKFQLKKQEEDMKQDLQVQTILCHNENVLTEYKLQVAKLAKNAKEVKDLLVKKEKVQLQKQLVQLVPQVQKFNLMAKQMDKRVQCGLSIEYKYICESEIIQVIKNNSYKSKLKITIHVINRDEGRSYYWNLDIFKNRFEHALQLWEEYIRKGPTFKYNKEIDPYWDPETYQTIAHAHLTLQCLMFNISFQGEIAIVRGGKKIGKMTISVWPSDAKGATNLSIDEKGQNGSYRITSPHQQLQKTLFFVMQITNIQLMQCSIDFDSLQFQYQLLQNIKMVKYTSDIIFKQQLYDYKYRKVHSIKEVSQATVIQYLEKAVAIEIQVIQKIMSSDQLTHRSSISTNAKSSFAIQNQGSDQKQEIEINQFQEISPPKPQQKIVKSVVLQRQQPSKSSPIRKQNSGVIFENTEITKRVEEEYQRKKKEETINFQSNQVNMKKKKNGQSVTTAAEASKKNEKECQIY